MIDRIDIARGRVRIALNAPALATALVVAAEDLAQSLLTIGAPFTCRRRGVETKIIAGDPLPAPDPALLRGLRNAHRWSAMMRGGTRLKAIADKVGYSESYIARVIPLACLSPRLQTAILDGTQPVALTLETLVRARLPLDWSAQERMFGATA